ncbi:MAG: FAD-binding protein [Micromonosporaceae bacterium]|nr:FAD-binding protein [Micromonosporaceae bacterium]
MTTPTLLRPAETGTEQALQTLRRALPDAVHVPGDEPYERQRPAYRGAPAIVVEAQSAAEVQTAVRVARANELPLTVQSTGHGTLVPPDGGILLRTSPMAQVLVDPDRRIAHVGAGARWSEVIAAAEPFGLAPLSGDTPSVGVVGYTLGGGLSWLSRKHGFAADSLLKAELVTANGRLVTAGQHHHADLFWALRGGSGNFGVITALEFRLYQAPQVYGGTAVFGIERAADALSFLNHHGDLLPDELSVSMVVTRHAPEVNGPALVLRAVHAGAGGEADAQAALEPLYHAAGSPAVESLRTMRYSEMASIGGTAPRGFAMSDSLSPALIGQLVDAVRDPESGVNAAEVKHWGGAIARPTHPAPGPVSHRHVPFAMKLDASPQAIDALTAEATGGSFLNFLHDTSQTHTAYTPDNHRRLREVKARYDPDNVFCRNHNIPPA